MRVCACLSHARAFARVVNACTTARLNESMLGDLAQALSSSYSRVLDCVCVPSNHDVLNASILGVLIQAGVEVQRTLFLIQACVT